VAARDRSTEYARGIALGAPGARQVADRWHLLANMRQVLERWLAGAHARLRRLPLAPGLPTSARAGWRTGPFRRTRAEGAARLGRRTRRVALYEEVRRRHAAGEKLLAISRAMGLAVGTVRKYAYAESFPVPETRPLRPSINTVQLGAWGCYAAGRLSRDRQRWLEPPPACPPASASATTSASA
jgi:hypothetical protein